MIAKMMSIHPKHSRMKRTGEIFARASGAINNAGIYGKNQAVAAAWVQLGHRALRKADEFSKKLPIPAGVKKHLSRKDVTFIAAAYAIPLPGTALFAAAIVGSRIGCRHLRNRLKPGLTLNAGNG